jgi:hypothetical protein
VLPLQPLERRVASPGVGEHICNIIEAPWLGNGGHGASLPVLVVLRQQALAAVGGRHFMVRTESKSIEP